MRVEKIKNVDALPTAIEREIRQRKKEEFYDSFLHENDLYLVASLGQKNTSGYEVSIGNIIAVDLEEWEVMMQQIEPEKEQVLAQVITTPLIILKIAIISEDKKAPKKIIFKNKKGEVIKGIKVKNKSS
jgi:hypothetical protein